MNAIQLSLLRSTPQLRRIIPLLITGSVATVMSHLQMGQLHKLGTGPRPRLMNHIHGGWSSTKSRPTFYKMHGINATQVSAKVHMCPSWGCISQFSYLRKVLVVELPNLTKTMSSTTSSLYHPRLFKHRPQKQTSPESPENRKYSPKLLNIITAYAQ